MIRRLVEEMQIVPAIIPIDLAAGANAGDWVSMKNYQHLTVIFFAAAGTAGDDPIFTLEQATAVAGTSNKALNFTDIYVKSGTLSSVGGFTKVTQTAANTYTNATHAEVQKVYVVEINAEDLDVENDFDCVQLSVPDVGAAAQIGCALYILSNPRHTELSSAIVD